MKLKRFLFSFFGIIVSGVAIYLIVKKIPLQDSWREIQKIAFWDIIVLMIIYLFSFLPRAYRWQLMLNNNKPNTKLGTYFKAIVVGFAGNNFLPVRGGEILRMEFFSRETNNSRVTVLASVLTEKILDGLALLLILILGIILSPFSLSNSSWLLNLVFLASILFLGSLVSIVILKWKKEPINKFLTKREDSSTFNFLFKVHEKIQSALVFLIIGKNTWLILIASIGIWLIEAIVFVLALLFLEIEVPVLIAGFLTLSIVNFGILIPSSPAYLGVFQAMTILALSLFTIPESTALSVGVIIHFSQFLPISILGGIILIVRFLR